MLFSFFYFSCPRLHFMIRALIERTRVIFSSPRASHSHHLHRLDRWAPSSVWTDLICTNNERNKFDGNDAAADRVIAVVGATPLSLFCFIVVTARKISFVACIRVYDLCRFGSFQLWAPVLQFAPYAVHFTTATSVVGRIHDKYAELMLVVFAPFFFGKWILICLVTVSALCWILSLYLSLCVELSLAIACWLFVCVACRHSRFSLDCARLLCCAVCCIMRNIATFYISSVSSEHRIWIISRHYSLLYQLQQSHTTTVWCARVFLGVGLRVLLHTVRNSTSTLFKSAWWKITNVFLMSSSIWLRMFA